MNINQEHLASKGWSGEEISHAKRVVAHAEANKSSRIRFLEKLTYIILFILMLVGALAGTWLIEPFLLIVNEKTGLSIMAFFGLLFGILGSVLVKDIESMETHHHLFITLTIPIVALITSVLISRQVSDVNLLNPEIKHNPYLLAIVFSISTLLPYLISQRKQRKKQ